MARDPRHSRSPWTAPRRHPCGFSDMRHEQCPTERALWGAALPSHLLEIKSPKQMQQGDCRVFRHEALRVPTQCCDQPSSGSPGQNPPQALPETPPRHTHGFSNAPCSSPALEEGGWWQEERDAAHLAAAGLGTAPLPTLRGQTGSRAPSTPGCCSPASSPSASQGVSAAGCSTKSSREPARAAEVLKFPSRPARRHPQHPAAERANPARLILILSSFQLIKASRHPAEDSLPVSLEGKAGP